MGWLAVEEWLLLAELLFSCGPRGIAEVVIAVNSDPPARPAGGGGGAGPCSWDGRQHRLIGVFLGLWRRGFIEEAVARGEATSDLYRLTDAGRRAAIGAPGLWHASASAS